MFRGLVAFDERGAIKGELAEKWEQADPKSYVFKIRTNATFHNGEPVTANDMKASFEAIKDPKSTAYLRQTFQVIDKIEAVDPKTVRISLKEPTPSFLSALATQNAPIVFATQMDKPDGMIGAGPYKLESAEKGVALTFKARPDFYRPGFPKTETIRFVACPDDSLRIAALQAGDVDIIEYVPWPEMKRLSEVTGALLDRITHHVSILEMNGESYRLAQSRARKAG